VTLTQRTPTPDHALRWFGVAAALDAVSALTWLLAFLNPFPPHPWIFLLFAAFAAASGAAGVTVACIALRNRRTSVSPGVLLIVLGVAPMLVVSCWRLIALFQLLPSG
jgi:hypothetical protein